jgi:hypothetical protein
VTGTFDVAQDLLDLVVLDREHERRIRLAEEPADRGDLGEAAAIRTEVIGHGRTVVMVDDGD